MEQKIIDVYIILWEIFIYLEFHADNKKDLFNQLKIIKFNGKWIYDSNITGEIITFY